MNREDFLMLKDDIVYFDNAATTLKSKNMIDSMVKYYSLYTSNIHRGDYDAALLTNKMYEKTRDIVKEFLNIGNDYEVVFTSGATMSINQVVFGFFKKVLKKNDIILLTKAEHASNVLPWLKLKEEIGIDIRYIDLNSDFEIDMKSLDNLINEKVKVISIAHITNVIGDVRDINKISEICKKNNIYLNIDGAQSVAHKKIDLCNLDISFLSFSGHKLGGPTGVGVLVGKKELLDKMDPLCLGGGMNDSFNECEYKLKKIPTRFEAGTPPIAEVIGLGEAINYLMKIGMDNIYKHELELKEYLISKLESINDIVIYNRNSKSGIVSFNINGVFAQDVSIYLNYHKICVRAGNHCAKLLGDVLGIKNTVRISMYFYNTKKDVDKFIKIIKDYKKIYDVVI